MADEENMFRVIAKIFKDDKSRSLCVVITIVTAVTLGTAFGIYNTSVVNNLKPAIVPRLDGLSTAENRSGEKYPFRFDDNNATSLQAPSETTWSLLVAAFSIGSGFSTLVAPLAAETVGRRRGLLLSALLNVAGGLMCSFYHYWFELAILGRLFIGVAFGIGVPLAAMFVTEIAPSNLRGACNAAIQAGAATGDALGMILSMPQIMGSNRLSNLALGFTAFTSLIMLIVVSFAHDSPRALILTSNDEKRGKRALEFYLGREEAKKTFDLLITEKGNFRHKGSVRNLTATLREAPFRALLIAVAALTMQMLSGISIIMGFSTDVFMENGFSTNGATKSSLILGFCNFATSFISVNLIERLGRRRLLLIGLIGTTLGTWSFTICSFMLHTTQIGDNFAYSLVAGLAIYALSYSFLSAAGSTIAAEVCDQKYRSYAISFGYFVALMVSTLTVMTYQPIKYYVGLTWVFFPYSCLALPVALILYLNISETSGIDLEKIQV